MADRNAGLRSSANIAVLLNIAAGTSEADSRPVEIKEAFAVFGIKPRFWLSSSGTDLSRSAREALNLGYPVIVAAGGDGTVSKVAGILAGTESALGLLPTGTLNHFAKDLNLPIDIREAAKVIAAGHTMAVDVGRINDRIFINNTSIGFYPELLRYRERLQRKGLSKWPAFASAALAVMVKPPSLLRLRLVVGQEQIEAVTGLILVGNNQYEITGWRIGARLKLDAGHLSLYFSRRTTKPGLIGLLLRAIFDIPPEEGDFEAHRTKELWIDTDKRILKAALDGELADLKPPLHFSIQPRFLKVVVGK